MEYDAAGNLTYDGLYAYAYDAWNRLVTVHHAFKDTGDSAGGLGSNGSNSVTLGSLQTGSLVHRSQYDGLNRRIVKAVTNSGDLNCTYHYYYDKDWRVIEQRNASNLVLKQMVWAPGSSQNGSGYTDELVQIRVNNNLDDPMMSQTMLPLDYPMEMYPGDHWVLQDANYNVLGLVDRDGKMVERYEYSPYGERKVFVSAGNNDAGCYAPTLLSRRVKDSYASLDQPFGLCEFGHQGFGHDEEIGIQIQRPRPYSPLHGWFMTRNHWGYIQNRHNLLEYELSSPTNYVEPFSAAASAAGGAALRLAGGAAAATEVVAVPGVAQVGLSFMAGYAIGSVIGDIIEKTVDVGLKPCKPCIPPLGTKAYRLDKVPPSTPHYPCPCDHMHIYQMHQSPKNCQCFWHPLEVICGNTPPPGIPPVVDAGGGGESP